jgi:hypothetical protein
MRILSSAAGAALGKLRLEFLVAAREFLLDLGSRLRPAVPGQNLPILGPHLCFVGLDIRNSCLNVIGGRRNRPAICS